MVVIRDGKYEVSWGFENVNRVEGIVQSNDEVINEFDLPNIQTKIKYEDFFESSDLIFTAISCNVKEEIVLNAIPNYNSIKYNISTKDLSAKKVDNKIVFYSELTGEEVFRFEEPFMYDSNFEYNSNFTVVLSEIKTNTYELEYVFDKEWLENSVRSFPVVIDPVATSQNSNNIDDNFVGELLPYSRNYGSSRMIIGNDHTYGLSRAFVKFLNLPTLPEGGELTSASLNLRLYNGTSTSGNIDVIPLSSNPWGIFADINWYLQSIFTYRTDLAARDVKSSSLWYNADITEFYKEYLNGNIGNHGFKIQYSNEAENDYNWIYTSNYSTGSYRPIIVVNYIDSNNYNNFDTWRYLFDDTNHSVISDKFYEKRTKS